MRGRRKRYHLTTLQICRMVACWRLEQQTNAPFIADDVAGIIDVERTMAGRFLREMEHAGMIRRVNGSTRHIHYRVTCDWVAIAVLMKARGEFPGACQYCGERDALPLRFAGAYLCRECMMKVSRDDLARKRRVAAGGGPTSSSA